MPLVVPPAFLEVYSEFKREHVVVVVSIAWGHVGSRKIDEGSGVREEGRERDRRRGEGGDASKGVRG